jgi:hypothetical protein
MPIINTLASMSGRNPFSSFSVLSKAYCEEKSPPNSPSHSSYNTLTTNAMSGFFAGFLTGIPVTYLEKLKIGEQVNKKSHNPNISTTQFIWNAWKEVKLGNIINFSSLFGCVVALEYSVLNEVGKNYGPIAGVGASGLTGAIFLTPADHMLYRNEELKESPLQATRALSKVGPRAFYAGFVPMFGRETGFTFAHGHASKFFGMLLYNYLHPEKPLVELGEVPENFQAAGSLVSGPTFAFITQYLDVLTRHYQKMIVKGVPATFKNAHNNITAELKPGETPLDGYIRGWKPRAVLCTFGGMTAFWAANKIQKFVTDNTSFKQAGPK